jgi:NADPH:quinone reductase-like Zn-dependent oxidoreductase
MSDSRDFALAYARWGGPENLNLMTGPEATELLESRSLGGGPHGPLPISPGFLDVSVKAVSVNPVDWKIMAGQQKFLASSRFPRIFGSDFAGTVIAAGAGSGFELGQPVMGMVNPLSGGSGRSRLRLPAAQCMPVPDGVKLQDAAGLPAAGISAMLATGFIDQMVTGRALVIGAAGGVGSLAVQRLLHRGWEVDAVCRDGAQREMLEGLGCRNFLPRRGWREEAAGMQWEAVVDCPGILHRDSPRSLLKPGGWYAPVYVPNNLILGNILRRPAWWVSGRMTSMFVAAPSGGRTEALSACIDAGGMKAVTDSIWPATESAKAVTRAIEGPLCGKVIIDFE